MTDVPEGPELPPHVQDQFDASVKDAQSQVKGFADAMGGLVDHHKGRQDRVTFEAIVEWLNGYLRSDTAQWCPHLQSPQPLHVNSWERPNVVRCLDCAAAVPSLPPGDATPCDICGRADLSGMEVSGNQVNNYIIFFRRCSRCRAESDARWADAP